MRATPRGISKILALALFASIPAASEAREIHLDCARTGQTVAVDVDTDRRFLQMMWGQGVAQEFLNGDSYVSGPDAFGETEKVTYVLNVDKEIVSFGEDRVCIKSGAKHPCVNKVSRNTLDVASGELRYEDGDEIAILQCQPAPPGRRF